MHRLLVILLVIRLLIPQAALAADVRTRPPGTPTPNHAYVFYLHGRIIETDGPRPTSPEFGLSGLPRYSRRARGERSDGDLGTTTESH